MEFTAFAWNMQRRRSFQPPASGETLLQEATRTKVKKALEYLCKTYDVGFITEPGMDLRSLVALGADGLPKGTWIRSTFKDDQSEASACRPLVYVKSGTATSYPVRFKSGAEGADRTPAGALWESGGHKILLISFHATSGFGGAGNVQDLLDWLEDHRTSTKPSRRGGWTTWLIGADFNAGDAKWGGLKMPAVKTHQSGHTLDGFFADRDDEAPEGDLITLKAVVAEGGFTLDYASDQTRGCYYMLTKVSDHRPICAQVEVVAEDVDM